MEIHLEVTLIIMNSNLSKSNKEIHCPVRPNVNQENISLIRKIYNLEFQLLFNKIRITKVEHLLNKIKPL